MCATVFVNTVLLYFCINDTYCTIIRGKCVYMSLCGEHMIKQVN